jgi:hypothetical protein
MIDTLCNLRLLGECKLANIRGLDYENGLFYFCDIKKSSGPLYVQAHKYIVIGLIAEAYGLANVSFSRHRKVHWSFVCDV